MSLSLFVLLGISGACCILLVLRAGDWMVRRTHSELDVIVRTDLASLFVFATQRQVFGLTLAVGVISAMIWWLLGAPWFVCLMASIPALWAPRLLIRWLHSRRLVRITSQLPDALAFWAGLLQSGQGLRAALNQLAEHQGKPLGDELRVVARQSRVGVPVEQAINQMCERLDVKDLQMLTVLLKMTQDRGGNLGESLQRLSSLLRERLAMEARIKALTSQGRMQGWIVGSLPLFLIAALAVVDPGSWQHFVGSPLGWVAMGLIAILEVTGFLLIRRIVAIEV